MPPTAAAAARREGSGPLGDSAGTLTIRAIWSDEEWDRMVAHHPEGTFFHTRMWARLVLASFPALRDECLWCESGSGPLLLPLFAWRRAGGLFTTLHSSFPFLYGGAIPALSGDGADRTREILPLLRRPWASVRAAGNPFAGAAGQRLSGYSLGLDSTHLLDLPSSEEEYSERVLTAAQRNDVRRLGKKGVMVEETRHLDAVDQVYRLYEDSFRRWGDRPAMVYPAAFYRNLLRLGGDAVRFTVARQEAKILGGMFVLRWNGLVHYLAGYFDPESRALRPNVLLQAESIRRAIRDGYRRYDFLPSGGHPSVETFKEGLGGKRVSFPVYRRSGLLHRFLGRGLSEGGALGRMSEDQRDLPGTGRTGSS